MSVACVTSAVRPQSMGKYYYLVLVFVDYPSPTMNSQLIGGQVTYAEFEQPKRKHSPRSRIYIKYVV